MPLRVPAERRLRTISAHASGGEPTATITWLAGAPRPAALRCDPFLCSLVPRPTAWLCVEAAEGESGPLLCLLEGFNAACDRPPCLMAGADALPPPILRALRATARCTVSVATPRERGSLARAAAGDGEPCGPALAFAEAGLEPATTDGWSGPPAVASSPARMACELVAEVDLGQGQSMLLLEIERFTILGDVLLRQAASTQQDAATQRGGNADARSVAAKLEAELVQPLGSLGNGRFGGLDGVSHMLRPVQAEGGDWSADGFSRATPPAAKGDYRTVTFDYRTEERCELGYNPLKQIVQPRPVGWISTYEAETRVAHIAPYSFFADVGRGDRPLVAFGSSRRPSDELKDAHKDAEEGGVFGWNVTTEGLAEAMNWSAVSAPSQPPSAALS